MADEEQWPTPQYAQEIVFEGCARLAIAPEEYEALYNAHADLRAKLEAAEQDASQLREAASAMLDKIDYNINNERLPLTYTVPWEQAVALRRAVRKETAIDAARGGERG